MKPEHEQSETHVLESIHKTIEKEGLLSADSLIVLAVSGGADSVCMAHALHALKGEWGVEFLVAHLDHRLRGTDSDDDADFVRSLAAQLGMDYVEGSEDVKVMAEVGGISLEMAARQARYDFLVQVAADRGAAGVATAHTYNDHIETIIMKWARGTGPQGLTGIPYKTTWKGISIVRPIRDLRRNQVETFLKERSAAWREDASNSDLSFRRNKVRHVVLPLLEKELNPGIADALARTASILREEETWLDGLSEALLEACALEKGGELVLRLEQLKKLHLAARRRVVRMWIVSRGFDPALMDYATGERIEDLIAGVEGTKSCDMSGGWKVVRQYDELHLVKTAGTSEQHEAYCVRVSVPGETLVPSEGFRIRAEWNRGVLKPARSGLGALPTEASLRAETLVGGDIHVRPWRDGDRIEPMGMEGSKKIQDVFVDQKVPREMRSRLPVFVDGDRIVWLPGYSVARSCAVTNDDMRALHLHLEPLGN